MKGATTTAILVLFAGALLSASPARACPNCKNALPTVRNMLAPDGTPIDPDTPGRRGDMARAYAVSIVFMFLVLSGVAFGVIRLIVRAGREATERAAASVARSNPL